jgi:hypothetical protein
MFNFFRKSKQQDNNENALKQDGIVDIIINDFVGFIAYTYRPGMIYDVSVLPYNKEHIKQACVLWMQNNKGTEMAEGWLSLFPILSRFQEGIGPKPAGTNYLSIDSNEEGKERIRDHRELSREISNKVDREYIELYDLAHKILD